jgi:hypothetical protein
MATEDRPPVRDAKRRPPPDPTIVARRLAEMLRGKAEYQARRKVHRAVATDVAAMARIANPAEARTYLTRREEEIALMWLGRYQLHEISTIMGLKDKNVVRRLLKRPAVARFVSLVEAAQLERIIAGEFGVRAQAKAAAPRVMRRMIEKAGGIEDETGRPTSMAARDADAIRAGEVVLGASGDKAPPEEHLHKHLHLAVGSLTTEELRRLAETGEWPTRYQALAAQLQAPDAPPAS